MKFIRIVWALMALNMRMAVRVPVAFFFSFVMPVLLFFLYAFVFGKGRPLGVSFMLGPLLTVILISNGLYGVGSTLVNMRESGALRRYQLAPVAAAHLVLSRLIGNFAIIGPVMAGLLAVAIGYFDIPFRGSVAELFLALACGALALSGLGLAVASVANSQQEAQMVNQVLFIALMFLSGATVPLGSLPSFLQTAAMFLPSTSLVMLIQGLVIHGDRLVVHGPEMAALLLAGGTGVMFAIHAFRWNGEEKASRAQRVAGVGLLIPYLALGAWLVVSQDHLKRNLELYRSVRAAADSSHGR